jgi:hypothetical protein
MNFAYWLRKSHGWIGLWGAILGLLFGFSGIWLNHRSVLKLPTAQVRINAQLALPDTLPSGAPAWPHGFKVHWERRSHHTMSAPNLPNACLGFCWWIP